MGPRARPISATSTPSTRVRASERQLPEAAPSQAVLQGCRKHWRRASTCRAMRTVAVTAASTVQNRPQCRGREEASMPWVIKRRPSGIRKGEPPTLAMRPRANRAPLTGWSLTAPRRAAKVADGAAGPARELRALQLRPRASSWKATNSQTPVPAAALAAPSAMQMRPASCTAPHRMSRRAFCRWRIACHAPYSRNSRPGMKRMKEPLAV